jgi:ornithine carbamoyltransferase
MNLISIFDLSHAEIEAIIEKGEELKREPKGARTRDDLKGKTLALIFEKPSTRTRVSFEVAMRELGGNVINLNRNELQLGRGERIKETARVLSSYVDAVMIRAYRHDTVAEFAQYASIPVINGLTDFEHPCQILADLMTIKEYKGRLADVKIAWIGDGNNVCNSLIGGAAIMGMNISVACPKGYEPATEIVEKAKNLGCDVVITENAEEAAADADVLYTDVWVSMGDEDDSERIKNDLKIYQINEDLVRVAKADVIVMHCMPVHIGEEITEGVMNSANSVIFEQAENRLHAQKALLLFFFFTKKENLY